MTRTRPEPGAGPRRATGRVLPWLLVVILLVVVAILLLPLGVKHGLQWWLAERSGGAATVQDVDFNLFTGDLDIEDIEVARGGEPLLKVGALRAHLNLRPLWRRELRLADIVLQDVDLDIRKTEDGRVVVGGIAAEDLGTSWALLVRELGLNRGRLRVALPRFNGTMEIAELRGDGIERGRTDGGESAELAAKLKGDGVKVQGRIYPPGRDLAPANAVDISGTLNVQGDIHSRNLRGEAWEFEGDGTLAVDGLSAAAGAVVMSEQLLSWTGGFKSRWSADAADASLRAQGRLTGVQSELTLRERNLHIVQDNLLWEGWLETGRGGNAGPHLRMNADAASDKLRVESAQDSKPLVAVDGLQLWGVAADDPERLGIGEVWLGPVHTGDAQAEAAEEGQAPGSFALSGISAQGVGLLRDERVEIGNLQLRNVHARILRDEQGRWHWPAGPALAFIGNLMRLAAAQGIAWRIGALETAGDAVVQFEDRLVQPAYLAAFEPFRLLVQDLDSGAPEQSSRLFVRTGLGGDSSIDITAGFRPLADDPGLDLTGQVANLKLAPLSSYSTRCMGYGFTEGELDGEFIVYLNKGQLWSSARTTLDDPKVWVDAPEAAQSAAASLGVPLHEALASLRANDGRIDLRLNVSGAVDAPAFDLCTAMKEALLGFLNQRLQRGTDQRSAAAGRSPADASQGGRAE